MGGAVVLEVQMREKGDVRARPSADIRYHRSNLSAMLHRWNPETQELESANSNRLNILAEGDQEIVEEFLVALDQLLSTLKQADAKEW